MSVSYRLLVFALALAILSINCAIADEFAFVHISEGHITGSGNFAGNLSAVFNEINAMQPQPAFVIMTGDQTETGLPRDWEKYRELCASLKVPLYQVLGNHETKWSDGSKDNLRRFFGQSPRYSFTHGNWRFIALDSSMWMQHHGLLDRSQLSWLQRELEQAPKMPTVLFYHHCPGFIPTENELLQVIRPYNVRLILVGHAHTFRTWKRNGVFFQMVKGTMNDQGGFRILEVSDTEIRSYTKLVGKERVLDAVIPLTSAPNPVRLLRPKTGKYVEGSLRIVATVTPAEGRKVEYGIDGDFKTITPSAKGYCDVVAEFDGTPGWHTVTVRATDPDGMEWTDTASVRLNGRSREAWRVQVSGGVQRAVRAAGDRLYFGTLGGDVYCLDARTGRQIWRRNTGADVVGEVAVADGLAFFGNTDGRIFALDAATGEQRWEYRTGGPIQGSAVVGDGRVFIGSAEPAFYSLDAKTGNLRWKYPMERFTQVRPLLMDGAVFFGAWDKHFYALNADDGTLRWKTLIGINFYYSTANSDPATDGRRIVVNVTPYSKAEVPEPDVYCLDAANGLVLWKVRNSGKSDCGFNSPAVVGDRAYSIAGNGELFAMQLSDGKEVLKAPLGLSIGTSAPVYADGRLYVTGLRGNVVCADARSGKKLWAYSTGGGYIFCPATVWEDLVIIPSTDGSITAVKR